MEETTQDSLKAYAPAGIGSRLVSKGIGSLNSAVAKEKAAIDHELSYLAGALEEVHNLFSQLEARVSPVSVQLPPQDSDTPAHEYVGSSSVYDRLHSSVVAIHMLQNRVATVVRNLEV